MHNDNTLNKKPIQTRGILTNLIMNCNIFKILAVSEIPKEFIADLRKSWFIVSQMLVRIIKYKIKINPGFILN